MASEKVVKLAALFYGARDSFKALWGERWREKLAFYRQCLDEGRRKHHCDSLDAALLIMKDLQATCPQSGNAQMGILAAVVEDMEPTPREETPDGE